MRRCGPSSVMPPSDPSPLPPARLPSSGPVRPPIRRLPGQHAAGGRRGQSQILRQRAAHGARDRKRPAGVGRQVGQDQSIAVRTDRGLKTSRIGRIEGVEQVADRLDVRACPGRFAAPRYRHETGRRDREVRRGY